jgi:hypothetical protein
VGGKGREGGREGGKGGGGDRVRAAARDGRERSGCIRIRLVL